MGALRFAPASLMDVVVAVGFRLPLPLPHDPPQGAARVKRPIIQGKGFHKRQYRINATFLFALQATTHITASNVTWWKAA
ncbi:hypothetical protein AAHA92_08875 [Salvia divinorum]|uniref:Uncharacterized protein n=1 Tax=Salvia divinorum TaxID=28513 RepID=A0ABD1HPN7_SALDI